MSARAARAAARGASGSGQPQASPSRSPRREPVDPIELRRELARKAVSSNQSPLLVLSESNYDQWLHAVRLKFTLCRLEGLLPDTLDPDIAGDAVLQQYGLALLLPTLSQKDQQHVFSSRTVADAIAAVHTARHGTRRIQQVNLLVQLFTMQMEPTEGIADFVQRVETLTRELADAGIQLDQLIPPIKVITSASKLDKNLLRPTLSWAVSTP